MTIRYVPPLDSSALDSPSRQIMQELIHGLESVKIFNADLKKVHEYERIAYENELDRKDRETEAIHNAALDEAAAHHNHIREEAEATLRAHLRAEEEAQRQREEAARKEKERIEKEKAEKLRREQEEAARVETERQAKEKAKAEEARKAQEAENARKAAIEEKQRKERETAEAQKRKAEQDAQKAKEEAEQQARSEQQQKLGAGRLSEKELGVQQRYVELHKVLKEFRAWLVGESKKNPEMKKYIGDLRRTIRKSVGQLRAGKGANTNQLAQIKSELEKAAAIPEPSVDVQRFIAFPPAEMAGSEHKISALLIYALNIYAKALVSALITEAALNPGHAEPIGIMAAQIFSQDGLMYKGIPLSDILMAKFRVVCPALWGFTGNDKTDSGRRALGWSREEAGGPFISEQAHLDRMTALGSGYAAITLRNFGKTARKNPFPNTMFWDSITKILAIPPSELQETQIILLGSLLRSSPERILGFFGQIGLVLMRKALVELPASVPRQTVAVIQLTALKETLRREKNILL
ncbi:hypothetical protein PENARI_c003G09078 [Penicillium arizonense]|uniref:mRNA export factor GLE1 n=1 Tax=Penicillium arizonense TaxID=1835702 RepID=A0A1F5LRW8_PENAI|nr:hypothetical protein PENARI_c003G09078 [Penicillium arizonense]OGE55954.1 hypothetical protein PENARI_c003G09078 [Penicillium arizonense]